MRMQYFGDSYDIVKRFLLQSLAPSTTWDAFPMFTNEVSALQLAAFEGFLGVRVASSGVLTPGADRAQNLRFMPHHHHVFVDPDTGIKLNPCGGAKSVSYVFGPELVGLCLEDPQRLVLVFDQSFSRSDDDRQAVIEKLVYFYGHGVHSFAYRSHACFVVLSANKPTLDIALDRLRETGLPSTRILHSSRA
ncbi:MAG: hypothetical protein ACYDHO_04935 [Gaiellaceae bacterium]